MGERSRYSNTHLYSVLLLHYLKKEPKINLEVWPTQTVFLCKIRPKPFIVNSLNNTADWQLTTQSSLAQYMVIITPVLQPVMTTSEVTKLGINVIYEASMSFIFSNMEFLEGMFARSLFSCSVSLSRVILSLCGYPRFLVVSPIWENFSFITDCCYDKPHSFPSYDSHAWILDCFILFIALSSVSSRSLLVALGASCLSLQQVQVPQTRCSVET